MNKENQDQEIIDRYIYDVIRRLPQDQRDDIEMELRSMIDDMIEDCTKEGKSIDDLLEELGSPSDLADNYRGEEKYLIGPEYYDSYVSVLKIVLLCTLIGAVISAFVNTISDIRVSEDLFSEWIKAGTTNIVESTISLISAFGFVTLIFMIMERQKVKVDVYNKANWTPKKLPPIPVKETLIKRGDCIVEIVFNMLFCGILIFAPKVFGAWIRVDGEIQAVPVFNLTVWNWIMPLFLVILGLNLIESIVKLLVGRYGMQIAVTTTVTSFLGFIIVLLIFRCFPVWNPDFVTNLELATGRSVSSQGDILYYWGSDIFSNVVIGIVFFAISIDVGTTIYKSYRYGDKNTSAF